MAMGMSIVSDDQRNKTWTSLSDEALGMMQVADSRTPTYSAHAHHPAPRVLHSPRFTSFPCTSLPCLSLPPSTSLSLSSTRRTTWARP
jgi:hypothetical protein